MTAPTRACSGTELARPRGTAAPAALPGPTADDDDDKLPAGMADGGKTSYCHSPLVSSRSTLNSNRVLPAASSFCTRVPTTSLGT